MKKTNSTTKAMIALIATDAVITTAAAIASAIKVRNNRSEVVNKTTEHRKPEVKMGNDIGEYLPLCIPGNSQVFATCLLKACCDHFGVNADTKKIEEAVKDDTFDLWFHHCDLHHDRDLDLTVYCKDEKKLRIEARYGKIIDILELTIVSDGESEDDHIIRTEIIRSEFSGSNRKYYSRSYDHETFEEALSTPEFRFLKESFNFKIVPKVEYNN